MDQKKNWKEFLEWGLKNEENRKRAIAATLNMMAVLNQSSGKKISHEELKELAGGFDDVAAAQL
ncbi:MAG: hypothetical protein K1060chlam5_00075 [Candidatus Anoxychlamydiales bacterium]|nr:hypothetical protein [Candidatus Anoxychlamydiales bacterium]